MRTMIILAACLGLAACGGKKKQEGTEGSGSATGSSMTGGSDKGSASTDKGSAAGSGSDKGSAAPAGSGSDQGSAAAGSGSGAPTVEGKPHMAGNCPSTVLGSETKAEVKGKDVILTITSADKDAIAAIQKRTTELLKEKSDGPSDPKGAHDQKGTQGGGKGICPVYWDDGGKATAKNDAKGVVITITPKGKADELKKTIDERIQKAADFVKAQIKPGDDKNQGGVGGATGPEGANHTGKGDGKGKERKGGDGGGGGGGTGGGGGKGTGGGGGSGKGSGK